MLSLARRSVLVAAVVAAAPVPAWAQEAKPVLVFAAASLQNALNAVAADWKTATGKSVVFSYAASSALAKQIEQGAPADLFASADPDWMDWAEKRGLIRAGTRKTLLGNRLVLVAGAQDGISLTIAPGFALREAIGESRLATGNPDAVPAGKYARQALTALGVWDKVAPRVAGADNVRAALVLVARGEARLGVVYQTDAAVEPKVRVVDTFPDGTHPPIAYPFAVTAASANPDARAFLDYLGSPTAAKAFEAQGFTVLK